MVKKAKADEGRAEAGADVDSAPQDAAEPVPETAEPMLEGDQGATGAAEPAIEAASEMVDVTLLVSRVGVNVSQNRGDTVSVPKNEAIRMIEAGQAMPVRDLAVERASE